MSASSPQRARRAAMVLAAATATAVALLSGVHWLTREAIVAAEVRREQQLQQAVLPSLRPPLQSVPWARPPCLEAAASAFCPDAATERWQRIVDADGQSALLIRTQSPPGYNAPIELLIGVLETGLIDGVRVLQHRETPGLGDGIERRRSSWIDSFRQRSLANTPVERWSAGRADSAFDAFTGATITPAAVVSGVYNTLRRLDAGAGHDGYP